MNQRFDILLIDDDDIDVATISQTLAKSDLRFSLITVPDGEAAFTVLRSQQLQRPYIILLDLYMPKLDGFAFLEVLRQDPLLRRNIVFVLTSSASDMDRLTTYREGIAGYLVKDKLGERYNQLAPFLAAYSNIIEFPDIW